MNDAVPPLLVFCACATVVSGSGEGPGTAKVGLFVALTCKDLDSYRLSVLNATVTAATSHIVDEVRHHQANFSLDVDVFDACQTKASVISLTAALQDPSSSYIAVVGPGLYHLCGIASELQRFRPVC